MKSFFKNRITEGRKAGYILVAMASVFSGLIVTGVMLFAGMVA